MPGKVSTMNGGLFRRSAPLVLAAALAGVLPAYPGEFPLTSTDGLELVNVLASAGELGGQRGLRVGGDPEVLAAACAKRREMVAAMRARGEQPHGPVTFESLRTNHLAVVEGVEFGSGTI